MSTKDFTANVISATKVVPDGNFKNSKASGIWDINEALDLIKGGNWPNVANTPPDAFVDALFSIDLWTGNDTERTITTGLDMSTNGGLVWLKNRDASASHHLFNTVSGATYYLQSNNTNAQDDSAQSLKSFGTTGFTIGGNSNVNNNGQGFCSWSFRKQPKFFDIVQYSGNGSAQTLSHNLGSTPGMIIVKRTDSAGSWRVFHRSLGETKALTLQTSGEGATSSSYWNNTAPTSTQFTIGTDLSDSGTNNFIAYLFAHNNDDGGFGEPGDQDIIKCDTYTGNGSSQDINVGFEPQFVIFKGTSEDNSQWQIVDTLRGLTVDQVTDKVIYANDDGAEASEDGNIGAEAFGVTNTGFSVAGTEVLHNKNGNNYIYMAIRRGGNKTPTAASDVFAVDTMANQTPAFDSTFPVDMVIRRNVGGVNTNTVWARITGQSYLNTNAADAASNDVETFDSNVGFGDGSTYSDNHAYMWARARGYFDALCYTGTGSARTVAHNLGVAPEMMWVKGRDSTDNWSVYHKDLNVGSGQYLQLNVSQAAGTNSNQFTTTAPTSSVFSLGSDGAVNGSGNTYIAYLFASLDGVSKVGSYTGNGSTTGPSIDCGFSAGPRFVLIKRTDSAENWYVFDSERGIVAGADPYLMLNSTSAQINAGDIIDPTSSGFQLATNGSSVNASGGTYIFYAIA